MGPADNLINGFQVSGTGDDGKAIALVDFEIQALQMKIYTVPLY